MFTTILVEVLLVLLLIGANGFFSGAELAIMMASKGRLNELANAGNSRAQAALDLANQPNRFLPTIQMGITLVGTLAAAYGGASLSVELEKILQRIPWVLLNHWSSELSLCIVVMGLTFTSILMGELIPKRIALHDAVRFACLVAPLITVIEVATRPFVWILGTTTDRVANVLGFRGQVPQVTSLQEIRQLIEMGTVSGLVDPVEQRLAFEALQLGDHTVRQVMRPRIDIDAIDIETPQDELLGTISMAGFSRLPVYEGDLDHIIGFVHLKDVLRQHYLGWQLELRKLCRKATIVPDTMRLDQLLVRFQEERNQVAIVVDEYGATRGMVTLEDVLEELVGELLTEHHPRVEQMIVPRDTGGWSVDGTVSLADLLKKIGRQSLLVKSPRNVSSVAGLVLHELGRLPIVGEQVIWQGLVFEVADLDGRRIDRVIVTIR